MGYGLTYGNRPKLDTHSLKEVYDGAALSSSQEADGKSWSDELRHDIQMRGNVKVFKSDLNFGVKTLIGQSNRYNAQEMLLRDAEGTITQRQNTESYNRSKTIPRLNGDVRYNLRLPQKRTVGISYNYSDNSSEGLNTTTTRYSPAREDYGRRSDNDMSSKIHNLRLDYHKRESGAHSLSATANYSHRSYGNMTEYEYLDESGRWSVDTERYDELEYIQQVAEVSPRWSYSKKIISTSLTLGLNYESDRGVFKATDTPLDYKRFDREPDGLRIDEDGQNEPFQRIG